MHHVSRRWLWACLAATAFVSAGCPKEKPVTVPGTTHGRILVDSPEVYGRERLARDRLEQQQWLEAQLEAVDQAVFGFQGAISSQQLSSRRFRAGVDASVGTALGVERSRAGIDAVERQSELEALRHEIERRRLQQELAALEAGDEGGGGDGEGAGEGGTAAEGSDAAGASTEGVLQRLLGSDALSADPSQLPSTTVATATGLVDRPVDLFLEKLALRERIRQELLENNLDDVHDLEGNTLYRLSFDTTVFPAHDTSAWAVVEVSLGDLYGECTGADNPDLYPVYFRWLDDLELSLNDDVDRLTELIQDKSRSTDELTDRERRFLARAFEELPIDDETRGAARTHLGAVNDYYQRVLQEPERVSAEVFEEEVQRVARAVVGEEFQQALDPDGSFVRISCGEEGGRLRVCQGTRYYLSNFCKELKRRQQTGWTSAYAITPKVTFERISNVRASRTARELALGLGATAGAAEFEAAFERAKVVDEATSAILRQPLVVGFSEMVDPSQVAEEERARTDLQILEARKPEVVQEVAELSRGEIAALEQKVLGLEQRLEEALSREQPAEEAPGVAVGEERARLRELPPPAAEREGTPELRGAEPVEDVESFREPEPIEEVRTADCGPYDIEAQNCRWRPSRDPELYDAQARPLFGWILGPRFRARSETDASYDFRFAPRPESLAAVISVPAWWPVAQIEVRTCWVHERHVRRGGERVCQPDAEGTVLPDRTVDYRVRLTGSSQAITSTLARVRRQPSAKLLAGRRLEVGRAGQVVLVGPELWRNPRVTLGGQTASAIEILPDMRGLIASFDSVQRPAGWTSQQRLGLEDVWVWTSEGRSLAGSAEVHLAPTTATSGLKPRFGMRVAVAKLTVNKGAGTVVVHFETSVEMPDKQPEEAIVKALFGVQGGEIAEIAADMPDKDRCLAAPSGVLFELQGFWKKQPCRYTVKLRNVTGDAVTLTAHQTIEKTRVDHPSISLLVDGS